MQNNVWKIGLYEQSEADGVCSGICKVCRDAGAKKHKYKISNESVKSLIVHTKQHSEYEAKLAKLEDNSKEAAVMQGFVVRPSRGMSSLDKKVINYIAENCASFNSVESRSFISLFNSTNLTENLKDRQHYSRIVLPRAYEAVVNLIKSKLKKCDSFSFTSDIWSSSSYSFISLTAHGIDGEWKRVKYVLAIWELPGSHTANHINAAIKKILEEWEIEQKQCHVFLRDGAVNMKKAFEGEFEHADCGAHKLNLTVKSTISSACPMIEEVLSKCRRIAGHFSFSNLAKDRLRVCQTDAAIETNRIIQDVAARWNSTLAMVERLLQQKRAVEIYFARHQLPTEAVNLSQMEWNLLKQLACLLEPAEASSLDMCKDDSHLGLQIGISQMLQAELTNADVRELEPEKDLLKAKVESRFGGLENNRIYGLALFLDPRFKDRRVANSAEFWLLIKNWIAREYQPIATEAQQVNDDMFLPVEEPVAKKPRSLIARQQVDQAENLPLPTIGRRISVSYVKHLFSSSFIELKEMVAYNAEKTMLMNSDPLIFWQKNVVRFPILSKAARRYLSAPSTSVASEQLFSHARDVFNYRRGQLDPYNAEQLIFLNKALEHVNFTY